MRQRGREQRELRKRWRLKWRGAVRRDGMYLVAAVVRTGVPDWTRYSNAPRGADHLLLAFLFYAFTIAAFFTSFDLCTSRSPAAAIYAPFENPSPHAYFTHVSLALLLVTCCSAVVPHHRAPESPIPVVSFFCTRLALSLAHTQSLSVSLSAKSTSRTNALYQRFFYGAQSCMNDLPAGFLKLDFVFV